MCDLSLLKDQHINQNISGQWLAVYTQSRQEERALEHLQRQNYQCFLPRVISRRKRTGKRIHCSEALFPRYLFLKASLQHDNLAPIRSTRGVNGLVRFALKPAVIPEDFINKLQSKVADDGHIHLDASRFSVGDNVRICDGALDGAIGTLLRSEADERVSLLIEIMGRETTVQVKSEYLEAV